MDKANRNFDSKHATKDEYGNITAKNQNGIDAKGKPVSDFLADIDMSSAMRDVIIRTEARKKT